MRQPNKRANHLKSFIRTCAAYNSYGAYGGKKAIEATPYPHRDQLTFENFFITAQKH